MRFNLIFMAIIMVSMEGTEGVEVDEKFCDRERRLLLAGVFNHENIVFAYSYKHVNDAQQQIVWRFQTTGNQLVEMGKSLTVEQVFPGIPLFRAGFGLNLKCEASDETCNLYNKLVFVFFQNFYKVFRFVNDRFADEPNAENIPWSLLPTGDVKRLGFDNEKLDNIYAAAFMPDPVGQQPLIFIVSKNTLFSSVVDIRAPSLKWNQLSEGKELANLLGAFILGEDLILNRNESPEGMALIYDRNGEQTKTITIWTYFGCKPTDDSPSESQQNSEEEKKYLKERSEQQEINNGYAAIILIVIIIAIIISNTISAIVWLTCGRAQQKGKRENPS